MGIKETMARLLWVLTQQRVGGSWRVNDILNLSQQGSRKSALNSAQNEPKRGSTWSVYNICTVKQHPRALVAARLGRPWSYSPPSLRQYTPALPATPVGSTGFASHYLVAHQSPIITHNKRPKQTHLQPACQPHDRASPTPCAPRWRGACTAGSRRPIVALISMPCRKRRNQPVYGGAEWLCRYHQRRAASREPQSVSQNTTSGRKFVQQDNPFPKMCILSFSLSFI